MALTYQKGSASVTLRRAAKDGAPGTNGKSAYELWLAEGHTGSIADFLKSLNGVSVVAIREEYAINNDKTNAPTTWYSTLQVPTKEKPYLWNRETSYADESMTKVIATTLPVIIGTYSADGRGIVGVEEQYLAYATEQSSIAATTAGQTTIAATGFGEEKQYLYNRERIKYSDNTYGEWTAWELISYYGNNGVDGDTPQPNLYGYDNNITSNRPAVHTHNGFATIIEGNGQTLFHNINAGYGSSSTFATGVYSVSCKVRFTNVVSMPDTFSVSLTMERGKLIAGSNLPLSSSGVEQSVVSCGTDYYFKFKWNLTTAYYPYFMLSGVYSYSKCMMEVSDLKIERAEDIKGISTPFSALAEDSIPQGVNLLNTTKTFTGWTTIGTTANALQGCYAAYASYNSSDNVNLAVTSAALKANTWYTLSWYARGSVNACQLLTQIYVTDYTSYYCPCPCGKDGVNLKTTDSLPKNKHTLGTDWEHHSLTFLNRSAQTAYIQFVLLFENYKSASVYISMPKLEEGDKPTAWQQSEEDRRGATGAHLRPRDEFKASNTYYYNDEYRDFCFKVETAADGVTQTPTFYVLKKKGTYYGGTYPLTNEDVWEKTVMSSFTATDILISNTFYTKVLTAVQAKIDELIVKRFSAIVDEKKIATINEFSNGGYIQYYSDGKTKRMEIVDGTIYYYNTDGSIKWLLGEDGTINKTNMQYFERVYLYKVVKADFSDIKVKTYIDGQLVKIYHTSVTPSLDLTYCRGTADDSQVPTSADHITDGWYTAEGVAEQYQVSSGTIPQYFRSCVRISSGKVVETKDVKFF